MTRTIANSVLVRRPIAAVFDTATTARYWPRWHPASLSVSGATDHPLQLGEQITERARIAGLPRTVRWTCVACDHPHRLALVAPGAPLQADLVFTFDQHGPEVICTRPFSYTLTLPLGGVLNALLLAGRMKQQSTQAMINLLALLNAEIPEG
jgi:hypothetical protein